MITKIEHKHKTKERREKKNRNLTVYAQYPKRDHQQKKQTWTKWQTPRWRKSDKSWKNVSGKWKNCAYSIVKGDSWYEREKRLNLFEEHAKVLKGGNPGEEKK